MKKEGILVSQCYDFAKNLEMIRKINRASIAEFSEELDVPKSTLQDILKDGNTSLHTALHIARKLNVLLSTLTGEVIPRENLTVLSALLRSFEWFDSLSGEDQKEVADHIRAIMEILQK